MGKMDIMPVVNLYKTDRNVDIWDSYFKSVHTKTTFMR